MALYTALAAGIGGGVLLAAGHPMTDVAMVGGAAVVLVAVLVFTSRRVGRPAPPDVRPSPLEHPSAEPPPEPPNSTEEVIDADDPPWAAFHQPRRGRRG